MKRGPKKLYYPRPGTITEQVLKLTTEGLSVKEAAAQVGTTTQAVYYSFKRYPHLRPLHLLPNGLKPESPTVVGSRITPLEYTELRHTLGITQQELADRLGVDIRTVQRRENGEILITNECVIAITSLGNYPPPPPRKRKRYTRQSSMEEQQNAIRQLDNRSSAVLQEASVERKQILITKTQNDFLRTLSTATGESECHLVRQAVDLLAKLYQSPT